jgi:hypothetical protein
MGVVASFVSLSLTPKQTNHDTHWIGPREGLDVMEKRKMSCKYQKSNSDSSVIQLRAYLCNNINVADIFVRAVTYLATA